MSTQKPRGGSGRGQGRKETPIEDKAVISGKVRVRLDPATEMVIPVDAETRALAQRLMLYDWPGVSRVEDLFGYALRRLAETTDD